MRIAFYKKMKEREDQQRKIQWEEEIRCSQKKAGTVSDLGSPKDSVECSDHESDSLGKRKFSNLVIDNEILTEVCVGGVLTSGSKQLKTECGGVRSGFSLTRDTSFQASGKKSCF
jgi:hypothetical protein